MKTNSTSLSGILGSNRDSGWNQRSGTAQLHNFRRRPARHTPSPHRFHRANRGKHLLRQPGLWRIRTQHRRSIVLVNVRPGISHPDL